MESLIIHSIFINILDDNTAVVSFTTCPIPSLKELGFPGCYCGYDFIRIFNSEFLYIYSKIITLDLSYNDFSYSTICKLCEILKDKDILPLLKNLSLEGNVLTNKDELIYNSINSSKRQMESINLSCIFIIII